MSTFVTSLFIDCCIEMFILFRGLRTAILDAKRERCLLSFDNPRNLKAEHGYETQASVSV